MYQLRSQGHFLPDAVTDTTSKREHLARRLFGDGAGVMCRLLALPRTHLCHLVIPLPPGLHLYSDGPREGHRLLSALLPNVPCWAVVALSRAMKPHLHVIAALPKETDPPKRCQYGRINIVPIVGADQLWRLATYLAKPHLEGASRTTPDDLRFYTLDQMWQQRLDAAEYYLQAKVTAGSRRLPHCSWTANLPKMKPDAPNWLVVWQANRAVQAKIYARSMGFLVKRPRQSSTKPGIGPIQQIYRRIRGPPLMRGMQSSAAAAAP